MNSTIKRIVSILMAAKAKNINRLYCQLPPKGAWKTAPRALFIWSTNPQLHRTQLYYTDDGGSMPGANFYLSPAKAAMSEPTMPTIPAGARPAPTWCLVQEPIVKDRLQC
jgi:hypothetical protein